MGGPAMLRRFEATLQGAVEQAGSRAADRGQAVVYLITDRRAVAAFAVADAVRPESREAVQRLHEQRIEVVMLTGDAKAVANAVAFAAVLMSASTIIVAINAQLLRRARL